jgi:hypothetical protein
MTRLSSSGCEVIGNLGVRYRHVNTSTATLKADTAFTPNKRFPDPAESVGLHIRPTV